MDFTDSDSSTPEVRLKYSSLSLQGEEYLNLASGVLELKLHKVHYAAKSSELARRTWLHSAPSAVSTQCQQRGSQVH